jgi:phosphatidylinositol alpha-mannosyltransferase
MKKSMSKQLPNTVSAPLRLKVAFVLDDSLDTPDGVQQYVLAIGRWLSGEGHEVHYLVGHTTRTDIANIHSLGRNVKVRFNQNRMSIPLPVSKRAVRQLLRKEHFDVIHVQMPYSPMLGARIVQAAPKETAVIGTFHVAPHSKLVYHANKALRMLLKRSLGRFDQVISVSEQAALLARQTFKLESIIIPNTIDLSRFYSGVAYSEFKQQLTVVFLGRLVKRKGAAHLLQAVEYIERHKLLPGVALQVVICGGGSLADDLKTFIGTHDLERRVRLEGFIAEEDKPRYLASADIAVFPSTGGESFGIVLIEAFAAARGAVLGGNNPGYAAVLADHPESLFNPKDTEQFAEVLVRNLADGNVRRAAHTWQQIAARQYDIPVVGKRILAVYSSALRKRRG